MTKFDRVLDALVEEVPGYLATQGLAPWTCIASTRIACLALAEIGMKASPMPVELYGFNERYLKAMNDREIGPERVLDEPQEATDARLKAEGAHAVAVGQAPPGVEQRTPEGRRGWSGHLVVLVERRWCVDLTTHQMTRPSKGMFFEPHHFRVTPEFMAGDPLSFPFGTSLATYVRSNDNTFVVTPDWRNVRRGDPMVRNVASMLR